MKSHHGMFSYSAKRRSWQLVATVSSRLMKNLSSSERHPERRKKLQQKDPKILQGGRAPGKPCDLGLAGAGQQDSCRDAEVVEHVPVGAIRRPAHRVGDVFVEAREESKPVLSRQVRPAVAAGIRSRDAAGLAAQHGFALVDAHAKSALGQFVSGAQPGDAASQNRNRLPHGCNSTPSAARILTGASGRYSRKRPKLSSVIFLAMGSRR